MAERLIFRFSDRPSPAAALDVRFRVAAVALISPLLIFAPVFSLVGLTLGVAGLLTLARTRWHEVWALTKGFGGFLLFFLAVGLLFLPTWENAAFLLVQSARLFVLLLTSQFLLLTLTAFELTAALQWFFSWLGRRRAWYLASMASWAVTSIPQVMDQAAVLREAASLRGLELKRHPLVWLKLLTLALMVRVVEKSAEMSWALEARCFGQAVPGIDLKAQLKDWGFLAVWTAWCGLAWWSASLVTFG